MTAIPNPSAIPPPNDAPSKPRDGSGVGVGCAGVLVETTCDDFEGDDFEGDGLVLITGVTVVSLTELPVPVVTGEFSVVILAVVLSVAMVSAVDGASDVGTTGQNTSFTILIIFTFRLAYM